MKSHFAQKYGDLEQWHWWFRGRKKILQSVLGRELHQSAQRSMLSIGCGPAAGLDWLIPFAGPRGHVVGLDINALHALHRPAGIGFVVGSAEKPPLADASFDVVLALDVLEHLDDDHAGLEEVLRLLRPGGMLLVTVPALPSLWGQQDIVSEHRRRYTRGTLKRLFDGAGLSHYWMSYFNSLFFPVVAGFRWTRRALRTGQNATSDFERNRPGLLNSALAVTFGGERHWLSHASLPIGVSLIAVYKRPAVATASGAAPDQRARRRPQRS